MKKIIFIIVLVIIVAFSVYNISIIDKCVAPNFNETDIKNPFENFLQNANKEFLNSSDKDKTQLETESANKSATEFATEATYVTSNQTAEYTVERVVDGDTIVVNIDGESTKVRFIGIDTPESVNPDADKNCEYGKVVSNYTKKLLNNKKVSLEYDVKSTDIYGRTLAYVYLDNKMVNKKLVAKGFAVAKEYEPNTKYSDMFTQTQVKAEKAKVGMWAYDTNCDLKNEYYISY